jgi:hypothetical protein
MKQRLFLLLAATLTVGISAAQAQSQPCVVKALGFPAPSRTLVKTPIPSGTCVATPGQTGRLRWDNNGSRELQLFDTDDGGKLLWCGHLHDGNTACAQGSSFCLQSDGNAVIYAGADCTGEALWASNTVGKNVNGEVMEVGDNFPGFTGEKAVILNNTNSGTANIVWTSNSQDPS